MLKSSIDPNGMPYKTIPDSRQRQQTKEFQQAYTVVSIVSNQSVGKPYFPDLYGV